MPSNNLSAGVDKLFHALSEALTIEKCSICLQKVEETVLLWPCGHWFCQKCTKKLHKNIVGKKTLCPLCNTATSRRSIVPFQEKQHEYDEYLARLVGAISLDLGFDITSYNTRGNDGRKNCENAEAHTIFNNVPSLKTAKQKEKMVTKSEEDLNLFKDKVRHVSRSSKLNSKTISKHTDKFPTPSLTMLPETPKHLKEKKVEDWIELSRFSVKDQDSLIEQDVKDQSTAKLGFPILSEDQLTSVSQLESNNAQVTYGNKKRKQNKCSALKNIEDSSSKKFDKLCLQENTSHVINNVCHLKNLRRKYNITSTPNKAESLPNNSQSNDYFEDFSSGSGEEWAINKKKKNLISKKAKGLKAKKTISSPSENDNIKPVELAKTYKNSSKSGIQNTRKLLRKCKESNNGVNNNFNIKKKGQLIDETTKDSVKDIINEWETTEDINCHQNESRKTIDDPSDITSVKKANPHSPGWSRMAITKKDFCVVEKKKLSLKTLSSTDSTPLQISKHSLLKDDSTINLLDITSPENLEEVCNYKNKIQFSEISIGNNEKKKMPNMLPNVAKKRDRDSGICNQSEFGSPERKKMCKDVEVQTSPSRMKACITEYLKNLSETEVKFLLTKCELMDTAIEQQHHYSCTDQVCDTMVNIDENLIQSALQQNKSSTDKENTDLQIKSICSEKCDSSDFIIGTEEYNGNKRGKELGENKSNHIATTKHLSGEYEHTIVDDESKCDQNKYMIKQDQIINDPNSIAQFYVHKTPLAKKPMLMEYSTKVFSAVSNPTESELRRVNDLFLNDSICPVATPVVPTPWNNSGIAPLQSGSEGGGKLAGRKFALTKSQDFKKKACRSKRQLNLDCFPNCETNDMLIKTSRQIFLHEEKKQMCQSNIVEYPQKSATAGKEDQDRDIFIDSNEKDCDEASDDSFIEGTPDASQTNIVLQQNGGQEVVKDAIRAPKLDSICQMKVNSSHVIKPDTINRSDSRSEQSTGINCVASENNKPLENPESQLSVENKNIHSDYVEINNKAVKNEESLNFVFATSLLSVQQNKMLGLLVRAFNIKYSKTVNEHVTHLIVSTSDGCTKNTYKVLYAMALHKPIIRFEWVEEVLTTATLLPMDPFTALGPNGECAVFRAKKDKNHQLLAHFAIHVYNVNESLVKKEQIEELVMLCGGTIVSSMQQFQDVSLDMHRVIVISEPDDSISQGEWRLNYRAAEVSMDWLFNTIGGYKIAPLAPYMLEPLGAEDFLLHEGYSENIIHDNSTFVL